MANVENAIFEKPQLHKMPSKYILSQFNAEMMDDDDDGSVCTEANDGDGDADDDSTAAVDTADYVNPVVVNQEDAEQAERVQPVNDSAHRFRLEVTLLTGNHSHGAGPPLGITQNGVENGQCSRNISDKHHRFLF